MKKSTKLLSVILALVMMFSTVSVAFAGTLNPNNKTKVEDFIKNDNLASIVETLINDLNNSKTSIAQPVLRICFLLVDQLKEAAGKTNAFTASDKELAKILLDWLDKNLPEWTKDINGKLDPIIAEIKKYTLNVVDLGDLINLKSVNGVLNTLYEVGSMKALLNLVGDAADINVKDLKNKKRDGTGATDLDIIYSLFSFLKNNTGLLKKFVLGGLDNSKGGIDLGIVGGFLGDNLGKINSIVTNLPTFLKGYIFLAVDGHAAKPDLKKDPAGGWGKDENYKSFTADQLLAAALLKLIKNDKKAVISNADADAALTKSFYTLLAENLDDLFANYDAADWLNENVPKFVNDISVTDEIKAVFNSSISFTNDTFKDIFTGAVSTGVLGQVNNLLCKIAEIALVPAENTKLALVKGGNENLNANLTKVCRYILAIMAESAEEVKAHLGYDFSAFTADAVAGKELKELAVPVLKLFFEDWFDNSLYWDKDAVEAATTLQQLGALAVYFTPGIDGADKYFATIHPVKPFNDLSTEQATGNMLENGARMLLGALVYNLADDGYFTPMVTSGYEALLDDISDWGLEFIKGIPAVIADAEKGGMKIQRGPYNNELLAGPFYKLNVVLNELIDLSFITVDSDKFTTFPFDIGLFLTDTLLNNIYEFDLEGILGALKRVSGSSLDKPVIGAILGIADKAVTALFKHTEGATKTATTTINNCNTKGNVKANITYCAANGHYTAFSTTGTVGSNHFYIGTATFTPVTCLQVSGTDRVCYQCGAATFQKAQDAENGPHRYDDKVTNPTCTVDGFTTHTCRYCDDTYVTNDENLKKLGHDYKTTKVVAPTCTAKGYTIENCSRCGVERKTKETAIVPHTYNAPVTEKATCTAAGKKYEKCKDCGYEHVIETYQKIQHSYTIRKTGKAATCAADGYDLLTCSICKKASKQEKIPATGKHTYKNGACTVCGAQDPNYKPTPVGPTYKLGDVDDDGAIKASDARLALRGAVGLKGDKDTKNAAINFADKASRAFLAGDVDFDGKISSSDARLILRASVGLEKPENWKK